MEQKVISKLKEIEKNLSIYQAFVNGGTASEDDRKVVSFKILYEMMAFSALQELVPDYIPSASTDYTMTTNGLRKMVDYVSVENDKVVISPEYKTILQQRDTFLKNNRN